MDQVASAIIISMVNPNERPEMLSHFTKLVRGVYNNSRQALDHYILAETVEYRIGTCGEPIRIIAVKPDPRLFSEWLCPWAAKQGVALWYEHTRRHLNEDQYVSVNWWTNHSIATSNPPPAFLALTGRGILRQGKIDSSNQYFYRFKVDDDDSRSAAFLLVLHRVAVVLVGVFPKSDLKNFASPMKKGDLFASSPTTGIIPAEGLR